MQNFAVASHSVPLNAPFRRGRVIQAYSDTGVKFSDVQGLTALKEELMTFVRIMRDDEEGARFREAKFALPKVRRDDSRLLTVPIRIPNHVTRSKFGIAVP